jgi:hypothetical protein
MEKILNAPYFTTNTNWNRTVGLYIFAQSTDATRWRAINIGQTDDFSSRMPDHERWNEAARLGATHVHAAVVPLAANRERLDKMLIQNFQAPLNVQLR